MDNECNGVILYAPFPLRKEFKDEECVIVMDHYGANELSAMMIDELMCHYSILRSRLQR